MLSQDKYDDSKWTLKEVGSSWLLETSYPDHVEFYVAQHVTDVVTAETVATTLCSCLNKNGYDELFLRSNVAVDYTSKTICIAKVVNITTNQKYSSAFDWLATQLAYMTMAKEIEKDMDSQILNKMLAYAKNYDKANTTTI
jgi:hypothetical protein